MKTLKGNLSQALEKLGHTNGTAPTPSQDILDAIAHEFTVAGFIKSYGEKRYSAAKDELINALSDDVSGKLDKLVEQVAKREVSGNVQLFNSQHHSAMAQVKIGASYLDEKALRVALLKKMKSEEVDKLFADATRRRNPSITYVIGEADDEG